jgi:Dyp-type peroxidase family
VGNINNAEILNNIEPINVDTLTKDSTYDKIFQDLQGGIIKNYGRNYSLYFFISFDQGKIGEIKKWIATEIAPSITSTSQQLENTKDFKLKKELTVNSNLNILVSDGELCKNFLLSQKGYDFLLAKKTEFDDPIFSDGMQEYWNKAYSLEPTEITTDDQEWYNPPENWDVGRVSQAPIHALITLFHDNLEELKQEANIMIKSCQNLGSIVACETGYLLKDDNTKTMIGPFGFADGISQPLFLKSDYDKYLSRYKTIAKWNPTASLSLVLVKDPWGGEYGYGSYCVWQKLETNYPRFQSSIKKLAEELACDEARANALVIGRSQNGAPLDFDQQLPESEATNISNDFNYSDDPDGSRCPIQAHARKVNPRYDNQDQAESRKKSRIFRAGTTYFDDPNLAKSTDMAQLCQGKLNYLATVSHESSAANVANISGLLFICFQNSIVNQFAKIQNEWSDDQDFPRSDNICLDPIIGNQKTYLNTKNLLPQSWPKQDGSGRKDLLFHGCVKIKGGEFFFAPSISFLKGL